MRFARSHGIRCQGRGSAANSLVAYLLAISPIDPLAHDLVFERFLSDERPSMPDIDLDIAADRRDQRSSSMSISRYGHDHAAMASTVITFQARSALRDVAHALDLPLELLAAGRSRRWRLNNRHPAARWHWSPSSAARSMGCRATSGSTAAAW